MPVPSGYFLLIVDPKAASLSSFTPLHSSPRQAPPPTKKRGGVRADSYARPSVSQRSASERKTASASRMRAVRQRSSGVWENFGSPGPK